jgi:hypothetical protein
MPEEPPVESPVEFRWFLEMTLLLFERYPFRWIAIDGRNIYENWDSIDDIVVADGETLGEAAEIARDYVDPVLLFYAFVDPPLEGIERQSTRSFA